MNRIHRIPAALGLVGALVASPADARATTARVSASREYLAGGLHRAVLGPHYRKLWAAPIEVEVLDLATYAGGLKPTKKAGGMQTKGLKFEGADGREYRIRSVDKDPAPTVRSRRIDSELAEHLVQDQISGQHPVGVIIADALADAAGIPHVSHQLFVVPDDPALGEFRQEFAGLLVVLEPNLDPEKPPLPGFEDVRELIQTSELWEALDKGGTAPVDARALLDDRLFDLFIGDWDRHMDNWEWVRRSGSDRWTPVPKDRDLAFAKFDGLALALARPATPRLVDFEKGYPNPVGLSWQAQHLDRRHLAGLEWPVWEEAAHALQKRLTDAAIEAAVRHEPPEYFAIDGPRMIAKLRARRDALPEAARELYRLLAQDVEVWGTGDGEEVQIVRDDQGRVDLTLGTRPDTGQPLQVALHRRFDPRETDEIRIYLGGGNDKVVVRGRRNGGPTLRVVGGEGDDLLDDHDGGETHFYDDRTGENRMVPGPGSTWDDRPFLRAQDDQGNARRDWGSQVLKLPWLRFGPDTGPFLGAELQLTNYGFRKQPYGSRQWLRLGWSTELHAARFEYQADVRRVHPHLRTELFLRASELENINFFGLGNQTTDGAPLDFYRTQQRQILFAPALVRDFGDYAALRIGLVGKYHRTKEPADRFLAQEAPYGVGPFGQAGATLGLHVDTRGTYRAGKSGLALDVAGAVYPPVWDVTSLFGEAHGTLGAYLAGGGALEPELALRAGGQQVWGTYPFHEAAYIGGQDTLRGLRGQRYAGDRSAYGSAELRLKMFSHHFQAAGRVGLLGFVDAGRVWLAGEDSTTWHHGVGGGLWMSFLRPENVVSVTAAQSEGDTRIYAGAGFAF